MSYWPESKDYEGDVLLAAELTKARNTMDIRADTISFPVTIGDVYRFRFTLAPYKHLPYKHLPYKHLPYKHLPYKHLPSQMVERTFLAAAYVDKPDGTYIRFEERSYTTGDKQ